MIRILIIEEQIEIIKPIKLLLEAKGFIVMWCHRGDLAIASVKDNKPDIVLLDLALPGLSGVEVCKRIRMFSNLPIIIITGNSSTKNIIDLYSHGIDAFINKPFNIYEILLRIDSVMKRCVIV